MKCKDMKAKIEFKISTEEMNDIIQCVGIQYEQRIRTLQDEIELYKQQISNLIKDSNK